MHWTSDREDLFGESTEPVDPPDGSGVILTVAFGCVWVCGFVLGGLSAIWFLG